MQRPRPLVTLALLATLLASTLSLGDLASSPHPAPHDSPHKAPLAFAQLESIRFQVVDPGAIALQGNWLRLGARQTPLKVLSEQRLPNGDRTLTVRGTDQTGGGLITLGKSGVYGTLHGPDGHRILTTDATGTWWVDVPATGIEINACATDHHGSQSLTAPAKSAGEPSLTKQRPVPGDQTQSEIGAVIDLLLIYNAALAERYPGDLIGTRLNHLVQIANQVFANSGLNAALRLVGTEPVTYRNDNSNFDFRNDISLALGGAEVIGLEGLAPLRDRLGADLVIGLRPHDIEQRGSCGIAFFPDGDANLGVNVVSEGSSSWSFCLDDVLTHEVGHNLGATHQIGAGGGIIDARGSAFTRSERFSTVMGSFGTGRPDRFRGLPIFSTPELPCGNEPCGRASDADNVAVMRDFLAEVSAYRTEAVTAPFPEMRNRLAGDQDGDGVSDWEDALPFNPEERADRDGDGRGDRGDAFPEDPAEQEDSDGDGIGDRSDADDDDDGTADDLDAFPRDPREQFDSDRDGVGDNRDAFPNRSMEYRDTDGDGIGDHADPDDDGDGIEEFSAGAEDLLVVSTGNSQVLRFAGESGDPRGVEVPPWDSLITFQSRLHWRRSDNTLLFTGDSGLRRMDLLNRELLGAWIEPYDERDPDAPQLRSGFPVGLASLDQGRRVIVSRMGNPTLATFQGAERPRDEPNVILGIGDDDAAGDLVSDGEEAFVIGRNRKQIYRVTPLNVQPLTPPDADWMLDPAFLALTDDGRLLVSDPGRNRIVAVDRDSGEWSGDLVNLTALGRSQPSGLALTREGELLVGLQDQDSILAFDARTGSLIDERIKGHGLERPGQLIIVPALADRFPRDPMRVLRPNPGLWLDPETDGRGFDIQIFGQRLSVIWYTYEPDGSPIWYLAAGDLVVDRFEAPLLRYEQRADGSTVSEPVGTIRLSFTSERRADAAWNVDGSAGRESLQWLAFTPRVEEQDNTGLWGRGDGPGWGVSLASQGAVTVAVAYLYDDTGAPRWAISQPATGAPPYQFQMMASFGENLCPACEGIPANVLVNVGDMQIDLTPIPRWTSAIAWPDPLSGNWVMDDVSIQRFSEPSIRPR